MPEDMPENVPDATTLPVADLLRVHRAEMPRLNTIWRYLRGSTADIYVPRSATREYKMLVDQARFNILPVPVNSLAQNLFIDGYRPHRAADNAAIWDAVWQPNRMDMRQAGIWRAALTYGWSYAAVLPGDPVSRITPYSPRRCTAIYDDPVNDEWPIWAAVWRNGVTVAESAVWTDPLAEPAQPGAGARVDVYDNRYRYQLRKDEGGWQIIGASAHDLGVCPVVRFTSVYQLDGDELMGEVEPLLPAQRQLNQTTFNLLMAQQYAAFRQRWITGMAIAEDENGNPIEPWNAAVNRVWQAESPDTKFGDFAQTDLNGYLDSRDKALLYISSLAQIPPHNLLVGAGISNLSAEALAALESGMRHKVAERQTSFGESAEQMLRLAGLAMGDKEAWDDTSAQVVWRDTTPRSLAQVADALGKLAQMLEVPPRALWERIPGVTDQDLARWAAMADDDEVLGRLAAMLEEQPGAESAGTGTDTPPPA